MSPVIDFYHEAVEPAFAELANLPETRNRKIKHFLKSAVYQRMAETFSHQKDGSWNE